jgi:phenylacetate-coenzyme A ligase PaaK-like adenylate-forming protein
MHKNFTQTQYSLVNLLHGSLLKEANLGINFESYEITDISINSPHCGKEKENRSSRIIGRQEGKKLLQDRKIT